MQPPPRKVKPAVQLKNIHSEQASKLQQKHQQESDLLEDIRLFSKQRSIIEKEYGQALCKVAQQFLAKRQFPTPPTLSSGDGKEYKTVMEVWKTVLERTDNVGKMRVQAAETYMQEISEPVKPIKVSKTQVAKKVFEQINTLHKEVASSVSEMVKSHKVYSEDEHVAHDAREKAMQVEEKVKNKSTGLFTSLATLQQKSAKLSSRRDQCDSKSTFSRNEYVLNQSAANAHQRRYYEADLPELLQMLDCEMYDKVKQFLTTLSRTELECCGLTQECFTKIMSDSCLISRDYNLRCFLQENLVFTDLVQYEFDPQDSDKIRNISGNHGAAHTLDKEARKWATKIAKENKAIRDGQRNLQQLQDHAGSDRKSCSSKDESAPSSPVDPEIKMEEIRQFIRKSETGKIKAEARIEALRLGGVNVEEWLNSANAEALAVEEEEAMTHQRSLSSASVKTESSGRSRTESATEDADANHMNSVSVSSAPNDSTYINYEEDDYEETFDSTGQSLPNVGPNTGRLYPLACTALYDFPASNSDELSLRENEALELIADGDGDGWVKARNSEGTIGLIPENYININEQANGISVDSTDVGHDQELPSSGYDSAPPSAGPDSSAPPSAGLDSRPSSIGQAGERISRTSGASRTSAYSATDYEVQQAVMGNAQTPTEPGVWARALYDYDSTCNEELSFQEGQLIHITRKDENGVDDGWWEGEINGQVGVFPSLVVEELAPDQVFTADGLTSPDRPGPPAFTPPEPGPLPPQLEFTQPTPSDETGPVLAARNDEDPVTASGDNTSEDFPPPPPPEALDSNEPTNCNPADANPNPIVDANNACDMVDPQQQVAQESVTMVTAEVHADPDAADEATSGDTSDTKEANTKAEGQPQPGQAAAMQVNQVNTNDVPFADEDNDESIV